MKKLITIFLVILTLVFAPLSVSAAKLPEVTDHEKVKVYLFWADYCGHCHNFIKYFSNKAANYEDYFEIVTFQTNNSKENSALMEELIKNYDDVKGGIPFIIIGSKFHQEGFGTDGKNIIDAALDAYEDKDYEDIVAKTIKETEIKAESKSYYDACTVAGVSCSREKSSGLSDGTVIAIIFGVIILGFGALVIFSRKK